MGGNLRKGRVLEKTKDWVRNDVLRRLLHDDCNPMPGTGRRKDLGCEMMCTYYTGIIAEILDRLDEQLKTEVLTCKLPAKLLRYLSISVSDETNIVQKVLLLWLNKLLTLKQKEPMLLQ